MGDNFYKVRKGLSLHNHDTEPAIEPGIDGRIYYDSNLQKARIQVNDSWTNLGGGGLGVINFIENYDAESGTEDWNLYKNSASATPDSGTGGIATGLTFSVTNNPAEVLYGIQSFKLSKSAVNAIGEGVSINFTMPEGYKRRNYINFICKTTDNFGYGDLTSSNPSDISIFVYDVDTSTLIPLDMNYLDGSGTFLAGFSPVDIDSNNYRLIFHVSTTNALAWDFLFDMVVVGPNNYTTGQAIETGIIQLTNGSGNNNFVTNFTEVSSGNGIIDYDSGVITVLKDCSIIVEVNSQNNPGSEIWPQIYKNGIEVRTGRYSGAVANFYGGIAYTDVVPAGTTFQIRVGGDNFNVRASIQATAKSKGILSSLAINTPVGFRAYKNGGSSIANTTISGWTAENFDNTNSFNSTTGVFNVPKTAYYLVSALISTGAPNLVQGSNNNISLRVNGTAVANGMSGFVGDGNLLRTLSLNTVLKLNAGESITLTTGQGLNLSTDNLSNYFSITEWVGPQTLLSEGTDAITFKYETAGGPVNISTAYSAIPINTAEGNGAFARLSGSQIILQPGRYLVIGYSWMSRAGGDGTSKNKLRRVSGTPQDVLFGTPGYYAGVSRATSPNNLNGVLNVATQSTFEFQARANAASSPLGFNPGYGDSNVYAYITFIRLG